LFTALIIPFSYVRHSIEQRIIDTFIDQLGGIHDSKYAFVPKANILNTDVN